MGILGSIFGSGKKVEELLGQGAVIVDVRSPGEYEIGHIEGSLNIPLGQLNSKVNKLKKLKKPVVLCCASGTRSGMAVSVLKSQGIECCNGGSWIQVDRRL